MITPSKMDEDEFTRHEQNKLSRESKGLTNEFSEYDRQNQKAIDFLDINLNVKFILRRQVTTEKAKIILDTLKKNLLLYDSLSFSEKDKHIESINFHSDSILDLRPEFIESIEAELDRVIDLF